MEGEWFRLDADATPLGFKGATKAGQPGVGLEDTSPTGLLDASSAPRYNASGEKCGLTEQSDGKVELIQHLVDSPQSRLAVWVPRRWLSLLNRFAQEV